MIARCFVDTNLLVYARDASETEKQPLAQAWMAVLWEARCGCTGIQVLSEYFVTTTRKLDPGLSEEDAWQEVEDLFAWNPVAVDEGVMRSARSVARRYSLSWWDALVVSAAQASTCQYLVTEDLQHDLDIGGLRVVDPFRHTPAEVLL